MRQFVISVLLLSVMASTSVQANKVACSQALSLIKSTWERVAKETENGSRFKFKKTEILPTLLWIEEQSVATEHFFLSLNDGISYEYQSPTGVKTAKIPQRVLLDFTRQVFETARRLSKRDEIDYNFILDFSYVFSLGQLVGSLSAGRDLAATTELWNSGLFKNVDRNNLEKAPYWLFLNEFPKHGVTTITDSDFWDDHLIRPPYALIVPTEKFLTLNDRLYISFRPIIPLKFESLVVEHPMLVNMHHLPLREPFSLYKSSLMQLFSLEKRFQVARGRSKAGFMYEVEKRQISHAYFVNALENDRALDQRNRDTIAAFWHYASFLKGHYEDIKTLPLKLQGTGDGDDLSVVDFLDLLDRDLELESLIQGGAPNPDEVFRAWNWIQLHFIP